MPRRSSSPRFAWRLGAIRGIEIFVHGTFLLLLVWLAFVAMRAGSTAAQTLMTVVFVLAVFGCVVLHELGHALVGARFGYPARDITLYPIGGIARLEKFPENPWQELAVAVAGPAVNVVIAAVLIVGLKLTGTWTPVTELDLMSGPILPRLAVVNVALAIFNMIPAFPMDGGRVLRALLATRIDPVRATEIAARAGRGFAVVLGILGLFGNVILVLIAVFVWFAGTQEMFTVQAKAAMRGVRVEHAMLTDFHVLHVTDPLPVAERALLAGSDTAFPVLGFDRRVTGILLRAPLLEAVATRPDATVGEVMDPEVEIVDADADLEPMLERLAAADGAPLVVVRNDKLVGLLTGENLTEYLALVRAHEAARTGDPGASAARGLKTAGFRT